VQMVHPQMTRIPLRPNPLQSSLRRRNARARQMFANGRGPVRHAHRPGSGGALYPYHRRPGPTVALIRRLAGARTTVVGTAEFAK